MTKFNVFDGWRTYQAYPYDLIFFHVSEELQERYGFTVIGVQTKNSNVNKGKPISWQDQSDYKPNAVDMTEYMLRASTDMSLGNIKVVDGAHWKGFLSHTHKIILNDYRQISIDSRKDADLYFKISQLIRISPNDKFGESYELDAVTQLLKEAGKI